MKQFHFTKRYFNKQIFEDPDSKVRVEVTEKPSLNLEEEEYSLRISTRYEDVATVHRNYAIEHNLPPSQHAFPHLQFKFHTEEIGQFRIRIDIENDEEYRKAILGFIYKIKDVIDDLEKYSEGITEEILVTELVDKLKDEGNFLSEKIFDGIKKYSLAFDKKRRTEESIGKLEENKLLLEFIGKDNFEIIKEELKK